LHPALCGFFRHGIDVDEHGMRGIAQDADGRGFAAAAGQGTGDSDSEQTEFHGRHTAEHRNSLARGALCFLVDVGRAAAHLGAAFMEING
jgi:hypothetical protein